MLLAALAVWILSPFQPDRTYLNFNDEQSAICELSKPQVTLRLYWGSGGAMASPHYEVTAQGDGTAEEKIFRSFDKPHIATLSCSDSIVTLMPLTSEESPILITADEIERVKGYPIQYA